MLAELGVPDDLEGIVGIQVFKARRAYAERSALDLPWRGLDGAHLILGELPDAYIEARILDAALRNAILLGIVGAGRPLEEHFRTVRERDEREGMWRSRPMTILVGWQRTAVLQRTPIGDYDWADISAEHDRGLKLRAELHEALGRLAVGVGLELGEALMDRVATHSFWIAPSRPPVIVLGEFSGSLDLSTGSMEPFPRDATTRWAQKLTVLPAELCLDLEESLDLLAAARATELNWTRFTLGWGALERLANNIGSRFDDQIIVEQRSCAQCGAAITSRKPSPRRRLEALADALALPTRSNVTAELGRATAIRGASHVGKIPNGTDLMLPERLAEQFLRAVVDQPTKIPI
jgi:hypothetical protein